jgi:hypothetical protein
MLELLTKIYSTKTERTALEISGRLSAVENAEESLPTLSPK